MVWFGLLAIVIALLVLPPEPLLLVLAVATAYGMSSSPTARSSS